jgi:hypothetical protein
MNKGIGFSRTIMLDWLDATASMCIQNIEPAEIRQRLGKIISGTIHGSEAQRKTIDVLLAVWVKTRIAVPLLHSMALKIYPSLSTSCERVWLHYGLCLAYYPIFRKCTSVIGQFGRTEEKITRNIVKERIAADYGHLGALDRSVERIIASLTNWGVLHVTSDRSIYEIQLQKFKTQDTLLMSWLLACALESHPSEGIPFNDLIHLPELFPFSLTMGIDALRKIPFIEVLRQGGGIDIINIMKN